MTWKRDLATWTLGAALLAILLPLTPAAAAAPQAATPAARSGMPGAAEEKPVPLIAKGDKKDKGKSPGKSNRGSSKSKSKSKSNSKTQKQSNSSSSKASHRDRDRRRADDARRREAAQRKAREDAHRRADEARRRDDARRRAAQLREREEARRRADDARRRQDAQRRADELRRRQEARQRADDLRRRLEQQRRQDEARRRDAQRSTRPELQRRTSPERTRPDTRSRTTEDRRSIRPPRLDPRRDTGDSRFRSRPSDAPRTSPRTSPRGGPDIVIMPPGTSPDRPGSREVLRRRPDRWTSRDTLSSPGTPTITPGGGGTVRPRITPNLTPVIHDDDPPELSPPPGLRLDRDADPGNDLDRFQPDPPHIWPRYDGEHDEDGGDYGDDDYHDDDEPYGGGHHYPPETVIEDVICDDFHYHHHYHYNFLDCGPGYWHHWRWGHRPWHGWRWWYCDGWDGWSFWFSFWGGRSCRWWFSFSFSFGDDFWGYCHPWRHYRLRYDGCYVRYHRPWRGWLRRHYRPHYYLHSRWPWQYHPGYDDWSAPRNDWYLSYRVSTPVYYVVEKPQPALPNIDDAWGVLRRGDLETARDMFSDLVYALPYEGEARIGYALASGLLYRDSAAVSAMRRAMRDEPSALRAVPRDASLRQRLRSLLDFYADRARRDFGDLDALFMVAALRYLLDEPSVAYFAADAAIRSGDEDTATRNLKLLIEETMYEAF